MTVSTMLAPGRCLRGHGPGQPARRAPTIFAQELTLPDIKEGPRGPVVVSLPLARAPRRWPSGSRTCSATHPGATEVHLRLTQPGRTVLMRLDDWLRVTATPALFGDLKALLGPACLSG